MKNFIIMAVIGYGIFVALKIVPKISDDKTFDSKVREIVQFAATNQLKLEDIRGQILAMVNSYKLPIKPEELTVEAQGQEWHVSVAYKREVSLILWTWRKSYSLDLRGPKA